MSEKMNENLTEKKNEKIETEIMLQYRGCEVDMETVMDRIWKNIQSKHISGEITSMDVYIKPEDSTVYYVVNNTISGRAPLF